MKRFLKAVIGGVVLVGAVLVFAPSADGRPAAIAIAIVWLPLMFWMARRDRRQQAAKEERRKARQQRRQPSAYR
jgi:uncharacterized membrane protein